MASCITHALSLVRDVAGPCVALPCPCRVTGRQEHGRARMWYMRPTARRGRGVRRAHRARSQERRAARSRAPRQGAKGISTGRTGYIQRRLQRWSQPNIRWYHFLDFLCAGRRRLFVFCYYFLSSNQFSKPFTSESEYLPNFRGGSSPRGTLCRHTLQAKRHIIARRHAVHHLRRGLWVRCYRTVRFGCARRGSVDASSYHGRLRV